MATEAKPASPKYTPGQRVEVLAFDYATTGGEAVWTCGTVTAVEPTYPECWNVEVARDGGKLYWQEIGQRGGDNLIRAL